MVCVVSSDPDPLQRWGSLDDDRFRGTDLVDKYKAGLGDDTVLAAGGDDILEGGPGADHLSGGAGNDQLLADEIYAFCNGLPLEDDAPDLLFGYGGNDTLTADGGGDSLFGGRGNDMLIVRRNETHTQETILNGGRGSDSLRGSDGIEKMWGGDGNDTFEGGRGRDVLTGGRGADTFVFEDDFQKTSIRDFDGSEGDIVVLDERTWDHLGELSKTEVVDHFGEINAIGTAILNFGANGMIVFRGHDDLTDVTDHIVFRDEYLGL